MNVSRRELLMMLPGLAVGLGDPARAAPSRVETFDSRTWKQLQAGLKSPTVVAFSATWCPNCPAVIEDLADDIRSRHFGGQLLAVVMDVAPGENDAGLMRPAHYQVADRLFAFSGQAPALRYAVDPTWRGATPFLAFLNPGRAPRFVTGPPQPEDLKAWMTPAKVK